jgi:3-phenylpropionate/cinnamic acid dioxygenase small subunit
MTTWPAASNQRATLDFSSLQTLALVAEVHAFLALEVQLLDDREYDRWLGLFTGDCLYWMPVDPLSEDGTLRLNVFYDDRAKMQDRVARLTSGSAYTEDPPSLTTRTLSAVRIETDECQGEVLVRSNFMLVAHRRGTQRLLAGRYRHSLVRADDGLRIAEKRVALFGSDAPQRAMTFLF